MVRLLALLFTLALATAAFPSRSNLSTPTLGHVVTADILKKKTTAPVLEVRGGGTIDANKYVQVTSAAYALYAAKCLLMPSSMVTDHFECPAPDGVTKFWIQGTASFMITLLFCFAKLPTDVAAQACLLGNALVAFLYPWNAKVSEDVFVS